MSLILWLLALLAEPVQFDDPCVPGTTMTGQIVSIANGDVIVRHGWHLYMLAYRVAEPLGWECK